MVSSIMDEIFTRKTQLVIKDVVEYANNKIEATKQELIYFTKHHAPFFQTRKMGHFLLKISDCLAICPPFKPAASG